MGPGRRVAIGKPAGGGTCAVRRDSAQGDPATCGREGLLERRQGSGTYLRNSAFDATLFHFFQTREHGAATSIPTSRLISRARVTAPAQVAETLGTRDVIQIQRLRCLSEQPLLCEVIYIPAAPFDGFEAIPETEMGPLLYPVYFERFCVFVARAEDEVHFGAADAQTAARLGTEEGHLVALIERTTFDMAGDAIEWRRASGRADRFRYRSRIG